MRKKFFSFCLIVSIVLSCVSFDVFAANSPQICLADLDYVDWGRYTGNMGDSCVFNLDQNGLPGMDNQYYRNGNIGVDGTVYNNGFEVWIARWNYGDDISWAYKTIDINGNFSKLTGSTGLIKSYNTTDFDTTAYFYDGETLLYSIRMTPNNWKHNFEIDVTGVEELKVMVKDNVKKAGGTSFALYDLFLETENDITTEKSYNKNFSRFSPGWYIYPLSSDLVADGASCTLEITNISDNVVEFVIEKVGRYYSPVYSSRVTAVVQNDLAVFNWSDTWGNSGNGELVFGDSYLKLTMKQTHTAEFNRSSLECEERIFYPETNDLIKNDIKVILNGREVSFDQPPILDPAGRVLVPIRKIAEAMGDDVKWNQDLKTAFVEHKERALIIPLYTDHLYIAYSDKPVEWKKYDLDVPSQEKNGRTLTPVRAFCESLGATVNWDDSTQTVYIEYNSNYDYDSLSYETINGINMAYSIMREHNNVSFEKYSEEIYAYLENSNSAVDNAAMSWGSGLFDGIVQLLSGEDATETAVKASLAQVISLLDDINRNDDNAEVIDGITYTKNGVDTLNTLLTLPKENLTINSIDDLEQLTDSVPQIKALSKHLETFEIFAFGTQEICYLLADYAQNITYLDNIEKYFMATSAGNDLLYKVIDDMRDEYTKKWIHSLTSLRDKGIDAVLSTLADTATGGVFGIVNFAKDLTNELTSLSTSAKGLKEFYALCILNVAFDEAYYDMMEDVSGIHFHSDEMIDMYNIQRAVKLSTYMSMNKIANSVDEVSWDESIDKLESMSYILWK